MKDRRLVLDIHIDITLDWLTGPTLGRIAENLHRFASDLMYAMVYKRDEGTFTLTKTMDDDGVIVGSFKITDIPPTKHACSDPACNEKH